MSGLSGPQARRGPCQLALLLLLLVGPSSVFAISFHLPLNSRKCLREEIHKDLLVTGAYEITDQSGGAGGLRTHLKVRHWAGQGGKTASVGEGRLRLEKGGQAGGGPKGGLASLERGGRALETAPSLRCLAFLGRGWAPMLGNP